MNDTLEFEATPESVGVSRSDHPTHQYPNPDLLSLLNRPVSGFLFFFEQRGSTVKASFCHLFALSKLVSWRRPPSARPCWTKAGRTEARSTTDTVLVQHLYLYGFFGCCFLTSKLQVLHQTQFLKKIKSTLLLSFKHLQCPKSPSSSFSLEKRSHWHLKCLKPNKCCFVLPFLITFRQTSWETLQAFYQHVF